MKDEKNGQKQLSDGKGDKDKAIEKAEKGPSVKKPVQPEVRQPEPRRTEPRQEDQRPDDRRRVSPPPSRGSGSIWSGDRKIMIISGVILLILMAAYLISRQPAQQLTIPQPQSKSPPATNPAPGPSVTPTPTPGAPSASQAAEDRLKKLRDKERTLVFRSQADKVAFYLDLGNANARVARSRGSDEYRKDAIKAYTIAETTYSQAKGKERDDAEVYMERVRKYRSEMEGIVFQR